MIGKLEFLNHGIDLDGITVAALVAREAPRVVIGIAAVPMYLRLSSGDHDDLLAG